MAVRIGARTGLPASPTDMLPCPTVAELLEQSSAGSVQHATDSADTHRHYAVAPVLGGVESLAAVYRAHRFTPHSQDAAVIGVVEQGQAVVCGAGERLELRTGDVLVIPPKVLHDAYSVGTEEWHYRALYLDTKQLTALAPATLDGHGVLGTRPFRLGDGDIASRVLAVHDDLRRVGADNAASLLDDMRALVEALDSGAAALRGEPADVHRISEGVARVRRVLDEDPLPKRSLTEMANLAQLSRFTFAHAFSRAYGIAPHAYALQRRIAAARDLLIAGELVSRAAHHVGFADQSHLTRRFISVVGVTPGEFRRAWRQVQDASSH